MRAFLARLSLHRRHGSWLLGFLAAGLLAIPVFANLPNSGFDAGDGNLVKDDEAFDWANVTPLNKSLDKLKGEGDNAFGEGTSEDDPVPSLKVDGIPPNKSDITRFYESHEVVSVSGSDKVFLYLAWERISDPSGTTNFDFELNQSSTMSSNGATPVRTAGDALIKYDLANGGTTPVLGFHRWVTAASAPAGSSANAVCEANSKFPCWDKVHPVVAPNFEASINTGAVTDPIAPDAPRTLSARTFGEAAINLTDAGILPTGGAGGGCIGFASAYLKSRSSDAFNSAIKDFASPVNANINLCKPLTIKAKKVDNSLPPNLLAGATFELYLDANKNGLIDTGETLLGTCSTTASVNPCTLVENRNGTGEECFVVKETVAPPGYNPPAVTTQAFCHTYSTTATTIERTFIDSPAPGTINIQKQDDAGNPIGGVTFTLYLDNTPFGPPDAGGPNQDQHGAEDSAQNALTCTTATSGADLGKCTISNIPLGKYWVVEEGGLPAGYDPAPDQYADVGLGASPGQGQTFNLTFVDPRKHRVIVLVCHEGTDTLAPSDVTIDGVEKTSLAAGSLTPAQQKALCDTGGASYGGISGHPTKSASIAVGSDAHP